jgi:hypothetical protein
LENMVLPVWIEHMTSPLPRDKAVKAKYLKRLSFPSDHRHRVSKTCLQECHPAHSRVVGDAPARRLCSPSPALIDPTALIHRGADVPAHPGCEQVAEPMLRDPAEQSMIGPDRCHEFASSFTLTRLCELPRLLYSRPSQSPAGSTLDGLEGGSILNAE